MDKTEFEKRMAARDARKAAIEAAKEEQRLNDRLLLDQLEEEHGDEAVRGVWTVGGLVAIRCPKRAEMKRFREVLLGTKKQNETGAARANAFLTLGNACVIHPPKEAYDALVERYPGITDLVSKAALEFAGDTEEEEAGKS